MSSNLQRQENTVLADLTHDRRRKIPALTGIRGYAAIWVVVFHVTSLAWRHFFGAWPGIHQLPIVSKGYLGVELFFILSGFILTKIYGDTVRSHSGVRDFLIGRIFRILPVYWCSLLGLAMLAPAMPGRWQGGDVHSLGNLLLALILVQAWIGRLTVWNVPGWSLSAEWLAYFVFPLLATVAARLPRAFAPLVLAATAYGALVISYYLRGVASLNNLGPFAVDRCLCEFALGVAVAKLDQLGLVRAKGGTAALSVGVLLLVLPMLSNAFDLLAVIAFALLVLAAGSVSHLAMILFGNPVAYFLGEISFSIYVLHWLLIELMFRFLPDTLPLLVGLAALPFLVVPIAWATWRWIEVPGQALGRVLVAYLRRVDKRPSTIAR